MNKCYLLKSKIYLLNQQQAVNLVELF